MCSCLSEGEPAAVRRGQWAAAVQLAPEIVLLLVSIFTLRDGGYLGIGGGATALAACSAPLACCRVPRGGVRAADVRQPGRDGVVRGAGGDPPLPPRHRRRLVLRPHRLLRHVLHRDDHARRHARLPRRPRRPRRRRVRVPGVGGCGPRARRRGRRGPPPSPRRRTATAAAAAAAAARRRRCGGGRAGGRSVGRARRQLTHARPLVAHTAPTLCVWESLCQWRRVMRHDCPRSAGGGPRGRTCRGRPFAIFSSRDYNISIECNFHHKGLSALRGDGRDERYRERRG